MPSRPRLSTVVLTHNAFLDKGGCVRHTLVALGQQQGVDFEVIVVDNGSGPEDQELLASACKSFRDSGMSVLCTQTQTSIGLARNAGAGLASSDLLVFLDDDAVLIDPCALQQLVAVAARSSHGYGAQRLWTPKHPWFIEHQNRLLAEMEAGIWETFAQALGPPQVSTKEEAVYFSRSFPGHFGFVHRDLFAKVGGFPANFVGYGYEDNALALACYLEDPTFGWLGALRVAHVDHPQPQRAGPENWANAGRFAELLAQRGLVAFDIAVLLEGAASEPARRVVIGAPRT